VPLSITAVTGESMRNLGITNTSDLAKIVPGFTAVQSPYGAPLYTLRGIGFFEESLGVSPTVAVYVDQVPLPYSAMTEGAALDLERVEALKGPQGTLFGQNSTGGAINYIAAKPTDHFTAGVTGDYGRFNMLNLEGFVSGPIAEGVNVRVAAREERRDAWQYSYTHNDSLGSRNFQTARILLDAQPTDTLKIELNLNGWSNQSEAQALQFQAYTPLVQGGYTDAPGFPNLAHDLANYPVAPHNDRAADWDPGVSFQRHDWFYQASLRGDLKLDDRTTLTSITAYANTKINRPGDGDGTIYPSQRQVLNGRIISISQELRLAGSVGSSDQLKWMVGGNYEHSSVDDVQKFILTGSNTGLGHGLDSLTYKGIPIGDYRFSGIEERDFQRVRTAAGFGSLDYNITDKLTAQGSVRYTDSRNRYNGCIGDRGDGTADLVLALLSGIATGHVDTNGVVTPAAFSVGQCATFGADNTLLADGIHHTLHETNVSWRGGLSYKFTPRVMVYANVTQGYKAGAFATGAILRAAQSTPAPQEELRAYEAGFKAEIPRTGQITGAAFYYDYKDKQLLSFLDTGFPFGVLPGLITVPKSRVEGAELDLTVRPFSGFTVRFGGTYINTKVKGSYVTPDQLAGTVQIGGLPFPNTPAWQLTNDAEYSFPAFNGKTLFLGGTLTYRSATEAAFGGGPLFHIPGYAPLDLRAGVESANGDWRLQAWGRNVTDHYEINFIRRIYDTTVRSTGMPATYGITISKKF